MKIPEIFTRWLASTVLTLLPPSDLFPNEAPDSTNVSGPMEIEAGFQYEDLDRNFADWRMMYLEVSKTFEFHTSIYGSVRQTDRFNVRDQEILAGATYPFGPSFAGLAEITGSPSHHVLASWSFLTQFQYELGGGSLAHAGWRYAQFTDASVNLGLFTFEQYWNSFRASYTLYLALIPQAAATTAHRFWMSWYYDGASAVNIAFSAGKEVENLGPVGGILSTHVRSFSFFGRHWLTPSWGVTYDATIHAQGDLYTRQGIRLGIRYLF